MTTESDSPDRLVVEEVEDGDGANGDAFEVGVSEGAGRDEEDDPGGVGSGLAGVDGAPAALVIPVASTLVIDGAPMVGGKAEENASEPGVS